MKLDTLIEVSPAETRVALVDEEGVLHRLDVHRAGRPSLHGAILRGRVARVEKSMKAAFLDLGASGEALLPRAHDGRGRPLTEGQWMVVQVSRDAQGAKGPAVTARPVLQDRYLSFMPFGLPNDMRVDFDRGLGKGRDLARVKRMAEAFDPGESGGWLFRPAAASLTQDRDMAVLTRCRDALLARWQAAQTANDGTAPKLLEDAPSYWEALVRDAPPTGRIATDDRLLHAKIKALAEERYPDLLDGLVFHNDRETLFDATAVEDQIEEAIARRVPLTGGGELVIDETEAMVVIDVNLADGAVALQGGDAAVRLNVRAAEAAGRQIVLRNLAGLIVIDFVKMKQRSDGKRVIEALRRGLKGSAGPGGGLADVLGMTAAGLVEVTRQRSGPSLTEQLLGPVSGDRPLSIDSQACAILRRAIRQTGGGRPTVYGPKPLLEAIRTRFKEALVETETRLGQPLDLVERDGRAAEMVMEKR